MVSAASLCEAWTVSILSIQSHVAYGHVGNSTAIPVVQRLGHEAWPVHTTLLSNHLGYPTHAGRVLPPGEVADHRVHDPVDHPWEHHAPADQHRAEAEPDGEDEQSPRIYVWAGCCRRCC